MQTRPGADEAYPADRPTHRPTQPPTHRPDHRPDQAQGRLLDGRYRIGPRIARGGMASVHEAVDVRLDRTVAVKIMHTGLFDAGDNEDFAERFVREARAAARLSHPNVVAVHDQGEEDGTVFLVMELVSGHTLRDTIAKESPMPAARALALIEPVLSALAAAHRAGLIHRDVKPENVLISDDGRIKVADFGLAKAVSADTQHTATQGVLIGTVSYLAPELVIDGRADERADVYAAGVLLYELLTGVKPHEGETPIAVAYKHVHHDVPPPSERVPGLPPYVDALVARATARDRTRRPADAAVMLHQVHRVSQALAEGLRDDPELTQDLSPSLTHRTTDLDELVEHAWEPFGQREPTTLLPVLTPQAPQLPHPPGPPDTTRPGARPGASQAPTQAPTPAPTPRRGGSSRPPRPPRPPRRRRRGLLLLAVGLVLAIGVGSGAFWYGWARYTSTPTVTGKIQTEAAATLEDAGLVVAYADPVYDADRRAGTVVATDPGGGARLLPGDTVTLTVSLGELLVPTVRGLGEDAAQDALLGRRLEFGESLPRYSETVPEGTVLASKPPAGTELEPGTSVDLVISQGRRPIPVGSWFDQPLDRVLRVLKGRGLEGEVVEERYDEDVVDGNVLSQDPTSGTLFRGDKVELVVSSGPELVEVPDTYLFGVEAAEQAMRDAGFEVTVEDAPGGFGLGYVTRSDPGFGSRAPLGATITLYVV